METEFKDRGGKVIHFGDIVQYRLSSPFLCRVVKGKRKRAVLVDYRSTDHFGINITKAIEKYISIIDISGRKYYTN